MEAFCELFALFLNGSYRVALDPSLVSWFKNSILGV